MKDVQSHYIGSNYLTPFNIRLSNYIRLARASGHDNDSVRPLCPLYPFFKEDRLYPYFIANGRDGDGAIQALITK